jgi:predicted choloylglycine hydrolase
MDVHGRVRLTPFTFRALEELEIGPKWRSMFEQVWPDYRQWFLQEGEEARASYATSARMLKVHMPELFPVYERLVELAGGGDLAARMLSIYKPPPYLAACSQGVWTRLGGPMLVRNYDYAPSRLEGLILHSRLLERRVIGMSDCLWGLLDGMNDAGLAVSLTFGGRRVLGDGFGIPLILRYILETCQTSKEAQEVLARVPLNLAHNVTIVDLHGDVVTVYLSPDREPVFSRSPAATNHQGFVDWPEQARATRTLEREQHMLELLHAPYSTVDGFADAFLQHYLYSTAYERGFGTLYTAVYLPAEGRAEYRWPGFTWRQSFDAFEEGMHEEILAEGVA